MSLEEIRKRIDSDAKAEADKAREEGCAEADAILSTAREDAAKILNAAKAEAAKEAEWARKELLSGAETEANAILLSARESAVEGHIGSVKGMVRSALSERKMLSTLVDGAAAEFEKFASRGDMVVRAGREYLSDVKKLGYVTEPGAEGELAIYSRDRSIMLDASPAALVDKYEADARSMLSRRLFGTGR